MPEPRHLVQTITPVSTPVTLQFALQFPADAIKFGLFVNADSELPGVPVLAVLFDNQSVRYADCERRIPYP